MQNLVLSVVKDRKWDDIRCYANSLARSGFDGDRVMIVDNVPQDAINQLLERRFLVIQKKIDGPHHFQTNRYQAACEYLTRTRHEYKYVFWTDVCDLVFQENPFSAIQKLIPGDDANHILVVNEGWKIKDQPINDIWIKRITNGSETYQELREKEVLCSGTIAGFAESMTWLFSCMLDESKRLNDGMQGIDQGIFNYLIRGHKFKGVTKIADPQDAFVTTAGIFLAPSDSKTWTIKPPYFDRTSGQAFVHDSLEPYAVLHQYNRNYGPMDEYGDFRFSVERRYWE